MNRMIRSHQAFTLIELLVVIAIIAILAAILFPVFGEARNKARQAQCLSNGKQIGTAIRMYVDDHDGRWPPFSGFNTNPPPGSAGHRGPEATLKPYTRTDELFRCNSDVGGVVTSGRTYYETFGQSYSLTSGCFSIIPGLSYSNDQDVTDPGGWFGWQPRTVTDSEFQYPSETRILREIMLPWFDDPANKYNQRQWYRRWHARGGTILFADGHARFLTSAEDYDRTRYTPAGALTSDNPAGSW